MNKNLWNKCDVCGRIIPFKDFEDESASRRMIAPDSDLSYEEFETLCKNHNSLNKLAAQAQ